MTSTSTSSWPRASTFTPPIDRRRPHVLPVAPTMPPAISIVSPPLNPVDRGLHELVDDRLQKHSQNQLSHTYDRPTRPAFA